jgi:hypothetical protein
MEATQTLSSIIATDKLVEIVQTAPSLLTDSRIRHDRAVAYGHKLLNQAEENGMNDELDTLMSEYQAKLRVTYKMIYEARRPFTQIVDEVKKEFTVLEADIDPAGKSNVFANVQKVRNIYVTEKVEAQKKKEAEMLRLQNMEKERIEIAKQVDIAINADFNNYLSGVKNAMNNIFEGMSLESSKTVGKTLLATPITLSKVMFDGFAKKQFFVNFITPLEVNGIITEKKTESLFADLNDVCSIELMEYRKELIEKVPSKVKELEAIAAAGAEEAARLQKEAAERKAVEAARLQAESDRKAKEAAQNAEIQAAGKTLEATINTQATLFTEAPKTKDGYLIEVVHRAGYGLLFQFWFEKEGNGLSVDKIEKKTIGQMKLFAENWAVQNDEKITSPLLKYHETYKAK